MDEFYDAWEYLQNRPEMMLDGIMCPVSHCLDVEVVKVDPKTYEMDLEDPSKNTCVQVWLEFGFPDKEFGATHDYDLDTGADTFEEAFIHLVDNVRSKYDTAK